MDEWLRDELDAQYESILSKIKGGSLYGEPVDITNTKMVVVAAYLLANSEATVQHMKDWEILGRLR